MSRSRSLIQGMFFPLSFFLEASKSGWRFIAIIGLFEKQLKPVIHVNISKSISLEIPNIILEFHSFRLVGRTLDKIM